MIILCGAPARPGLSEAFLWASRFLLFVANRRVTLNIPWTVDKAMTDETSPPEVSRVWELVDGTMSQDTEWSVKVGSSGPGGDFETMFVPRLRRSDTAP